MVYTQAQQGRCLMKKEEGDCERIPLSFLPTVSHTLSCLFWASWHPLFSHI